MDIFHSKSNPSVGNELRKASSDGVENDEQGTPAADTAESQGEIESRADDGAADEGNDEDDDGGDSAGDDEDCDWEEEEEEEEDTSIPKYTAAELASFFLDFYTFLGTLHYDPADLRIPPPEGWPALPEDGPANYRSAFATEVIRRLPYFYSNAAIHYKSALMDYSTMDPKYFDPDDPVEPDYLDLYSDRQDGPADMADVVQIASGHESGGRDFFLNTHAGEICEEVIRCDGLGPYDVRDWMRDMKEAYRSLALVPCVGRVTIEADRVPERGDEIAEAEVRAQDERWGTNLDVQYVRQVYRRHGWPDAFRREEAMAVIDGLVEDMRETRGNWEEEAEWNLTTGM